MSPELICLLFVGAVTLAASYFQSVTGFGFGILAMIFLPSLLAYSEANVLSSILSSLVSLITVLPMFGLVSRKNLIFPLVGNLITNYLAVNFLKGAGNDTLKAMLGGVLVLLSIYFFFFSERIRIRASWRSGLIAGLISGLLSGLFAIGGPPVVIYYLQSEKDTDHYMATISAYFVLSGVITVSMKAAAGFVTGTVLLAILFGLAGMLAGSFIGKKTRSRLNSGIMRKLVYAVMAFSGVVNMVTSIG